jgi:hypothetical protein
MQKKNTLESYGSLNKSKFRVGSHSVTQLYFCVLLKPHKFDMLFIYVYYFYMLRKKLKISTCQGKALCAARVTENRSDFRTQGNF